MGHADFLAAMLGALPIATLVLDTAGVILACNTPAERTFGCPAGAAGVPLEEVRALDRLPAVQSAVRQTLREPAPVDVETVDADGVSVTCRLRLIRSADITVLVLTAEERVEALRVANAELRARLEELRDAAEVARHKDDFLAMLAHELRNPLAPILSAMQVIRRHQDNAEVVQRAREIVERQVRHQARLLDDLLDVSRITRGRIQLRKAPVDVRTAVATAVEAAKPLIDSRRHTLTVVVPDTPVRVQGDPTRLTQIVANLLDNAAKYSDPGGQIDLAVRREDTHVVVQVRDTGMGIARDMLGRVFDLFTQGDVSIARSLGGLGLGLTLVRSLTELHGGTVAVASDGPGRGSEFTVRLPLSTSDAIECPPPRKTPGARRVLVIEDNADAREMLRLALELDGHQVETAVDGLSGVETALRIMPDLVLVDIGLPGLDGYAVAQRLRAALGDRLTLVALTGYGQSEDRRRASESGFDAHLVKPVDPDVLTRALATGFGAAA